MNNISEFIFQQTGAKPSYFTPNSRYFGIETTQVTTEAGETVRYVRRRFLPYPDKFQTIQEHIVLQGERPDLLTHKYLNDPEQFWRICDANGVMHPNELTDAVGHVVRITLPEGIVQP